MGVAQDPRIGEVLVREDAGWIELHVLLEALTPVELELPGYYAEGWSAKDALAHIGTWLAEAGQALEQIRSQTYRPGELDIDRRNAEWLESLRPEPVPIVRAQAEAARTRMLTALGEQREYVVHVREWVAKSGPDHYEEHLPRLREWVPELIAARR